MPLAENLGVDVDDRPPAPDDNEVAPGGPGTDRRALAGVVARCVAVFLASRVAGLAAVWFGKNLTGRGMDDFLAKWDSAWYLLVAQAGYPHDLPADAPPGTQSPIALFPGLPLMVRALSAVTGWAPVTSGAVLALVGGAFAVVAIWFLARALADEATADRAVVLFSFFPGAYVFSFVYPEGFFIAAAAACLLFLVQRNWLLAGVAAAVAGVFRPNGMFLAVCCGVAALVALRRDRDWRALLAPLLAPLGTVAFFAVLWARSGEPTVWFRAQSLGWGQKLDWGATALERTGNVVESPLRDANHLIEVLVVVCAVAMAVLLVRLRPPAVVWLYTALMLLPLMLTATFPITPRSLVTAFPLLIGLAYAARGTAFTTLVAVSASLMTTLLIVVGTSLMVTP